MHCFLYDSDLRFKELKTVKNMTFKASHKRTPLKIENTLFPTNRP